jgi:transcriptional regulator with XRE-family HTH domain
MINLVEHGMTASSYRRADPEAQAGRALRRLRLARSWSQEEVAVRMTAYGYDFHQTTIAKIEAAQRPLRVRELADFAALYGVEVQDLVYPPSGSLPEIDEEIIEVRARLSKARHVADAASAQLESAHTAAREAEATHRASLAEVTFLEGRLTSLSADREKVISWESEVESSLAGASAETEQGAFESTASITSIAEGGPTALRIVLGTHLRRLREAQGIPAEGAAAELRASASKITRIEMGRTGVKERDLVDLLTLYGVKSPAERARLVELARQANSPGWWHDYSDILPGWFEPYIGLEMAATEVWVHAVQSVPDLLQTEDYSRAATLSDYRDSSTRDSERRVRLRRVRQEKFFERSDPPHLWVLLDEAVLRRQFGGPAVMRGQLDHLAELAEQPQITVQVLPLETRGSTETSFNILRFAESSLPGLVYLEQLSSAIYLEKPTDVDIYQTAMQRLSTQALAPHRTIMFLQKLIAMSAHGN